MRFGLGSASLLENERFHNTTDLTDYLGGDYLAYEQEKLDKKSQMEEFMFLGLRMTEGISTECFRQTFGLTVELVYGPVLEQQIEDQLLRKEDGRIFLTERGLDVSNYVMAQFLLDK